MVSYYNYPSYNDKAYEVRYPKNNYDKYVDRVYRNEKGINKIYKTLPYDDSYFKERYRGFRYDSRLYKFEKYLTDSELHLLDKYMMYDSAKKYYKEYSGINADYYDFKISDKLSRHKDYINQYAVTVHRDKGRHRQRSFYHQSRVYSESEMRNLYPELFKEYREDIQGLLSLASVREARQRGLFSRPTYTNEDVMRYLFYTGSLDGNLYLRENGKKLYINDPVIQSDLRVVQKVQEKLGMKNKISDIVDFGTPATNDLQLGSPPHPNVDSNDILYNLDFSRKQDAKIKDAARGKGRAEVIPSNRISERFFAKNPLIYRLINKMHGNTNVIV